MSKVTFLILGDLHGNIPTFHTQNFDAIICPGDICGDDIRSDNLSEEEVENYEQISLDKGRVVLEYLNNQGVPVFLVPGNWDHTPYRDGMGPYVLDPEVNPWEKIKVGLENIYDVEYTKAEFEGIAIVGHGSTSSPEPLEIEADTNEEELDSRELFFRHRFAELNAFMQEENKPTILISHNAPYGTKLDLINNESSYAHGEHYGSGLTRALIEENKPLMCVSGHIHEGVGQELVGKTTCINSGFKGDINVIVEIDVDNGKIERIEFLGKSAGN
jgi:Icc-related predicted phosphoesterase